MKYSDSVKQLWATALQMQPAQIDADTSFFELGGYSLLAVKLATLISTELDVNCDPVAILVHSTVNKLTDYLENQGSKTKKSIQPSKTEGKRIPLTPLQEAYWLGEQQQYDLSGPGTWYAEYAAQHVDHIKLQGAMDSMVRRHAALRTVFDKDAYQIVLSEVASFPVDFYDLRACEEPRRIEMLADIRCKLKTTFRALDQWPLLSLAVVKLNSEYRILIAGRLIIMDGRSAEVFARDLWCLYNDHPLPELKLQATDVIMHQMGESEKGSPERIGSDQYWRERIDVLPPSPNIPLDFSLRKSTSKSMKRYSFQLERRLWKKFKHGCAAVSLTPTTVILTAFSRLLAKWCNQEQFTINVMYGNRQPIHDDINAIIGCLSNTLLLGIDARGDFVTSGRRIQAQLYSDMAHWQTPGVEVLRQINGRNGGGYANPLVPVAFASGLGLDPEVDADNSGYFLEIFGWKATESNLQTPHVLLDHQIVESQGNLVVQWDVREGLFPLDLVQDMFESYHQMLVHMAETHDWQSLEIPIPYSQSLTRAKANNTFLEDNRNELLHEGFYRNALEKPDRYAVLTPGFSLTYGSLLNNAIHYARLLRSSGVLPGDKVGILLPKGHGQVIGVLATLFANAIYVPLSVEAPIKRNIAILQRCGIKVVFAESGDAVANESLQVITINDANVDSVDPLDWDPFLTDPTSPAYIIFTSGTTGEPKGVVISHLGAMNTIRDINRRFAIDHNDSVLSVSELNFDLSVYDIFGSLAAGSRIVIPRHTLVKNPIHLAQLVDEYKTTVWNSVPAFFELFYEYCDNRKTKSLKNIDHVFLSGDWIPIDLPSRIKSHNPGCQVVAMGGATEASIWSNYYVVGDVPDHWPSIPYGKPLANQSFYVLDHTLQDVPDWTPGELYIGGIGLAIEYYEDTTLTRQSFIDHPHHGRIYRTGDWGRYWNDGTLEFLGRKDSQVKIRGHRIELGEIEVCISKLPAVRRAKALVFQNGAEADELCAFITSNSDEVTEQWLRAEIAKNLPDYMVPSTIHILKDFPLTPNGKIDNKRLLALAHSRSESSEPLLLPQSVIQKQVAKVWRNILKVDTVFLESNFLALGGNSISMVRMVNQVSDEIGLPLNLSIAYEQGNLGEFCKKIEEFVQDNTRRHLVAISTSAPTTNHTFYFVHPVGGSVFCYQDLSKMLNSHSYGLQASGVQEGQELITSISEMASRYAKEIMVAHRFGTVVLLGWSMGGLIASEMARILLKNGMMSKVIMLDTWVGNGLETTVDPKSFLDRFFFDLSAGKLTNIPGAELSGPVNNIEDGLNRLEQQGIVSGLSPDLVHRLFNLFVNNSIAIAKHIPYTSRTPTLLFQANIGDPEKMINLIRISESEDWLDALPGLTIKTVDADHFSIISNETLEQLLPDINAFLDGTSS